VQDVIIRKARPEDRPEWLRMRRALWDDCPDEQQVREMKEILGSDMEEVFFAERPEGCAASWRLRSQGGLND
jgi:aminoglycoside 6'-N-acetyltransferase I